MGAVAAHADSESYMRCVAMGLGHMGIATPVHAQQAEWDSYVAIGRNVDQNVHQNGASPQSQITLLDQQGHTHAVSGAIVQCALVNDPI
jgi:Zn-dependent alcohol dehydrogenase